MDIGEGKIIVKRWSQIGVFIASFAGFSVALTAQAEELARLFFGTQERQVLNQKRLASAKSHASIERKNAKVEEQVSESMPVPAPKITGRVIRSSGNNTVWVNRSPNYVRRQSPNHNSD